MMSMSHPDIERLWGGTTIRFEGFVVSVDSATERYIRPSNVLPKLSDNRSLLYTLSTKAFVTMQFFSHLALLTALMTSAFAAPIERGEEHLPG